MSNRQIYTENLMVYSFLNIFGGMKDTHAEGSRVHHLIIRGSALGFLSSAQEMNKSHPHQYDHGIPKN